VKASPATNASPDLDNKKKVSEELNANVAASADARDNNVATAPSDAHNLGEATLRRKLTAKGPRVTRNITEEEVILEMKALCTKGNPLDKYERDIELGSGAAGVVFLAVDKTSKERVAIKIIDLQKQPKKDMILMELKVIIYRRISAPLLIYAYLIPPGHERAAPSKSGELRRMLHGGFAPLGRDGIFGRWTSHRCRHGDHHEGGSDRRSLPRGTLVATSRVSRFNEHLFSTGSKGNGVSSQERHIASGYQIG
jgi:hypothetical protein